MNDLPLKSAQSIIRKTWANAIGKKKPTKTNFIKAVKATCPSRKNFDELYKILQPYVNRLLKLEELNEEDLVLNSSNNTVIQKSIYQKGKENFQRKFGDKIPWYMKS